MNKLRKSAASVLLATLGTAAASTGWAGDIVLSVEEPVAGSTYTGIANIRGWVVGSAGISRVELYINGVLRTNIPVGGSRGDVGNQYPNYPNSSNSGFSMAFNYSGMNEGPHSITIRAVDNEGNFEDSSAAFNVVRFDNPFIPNPSSVFLDGATISHDGQSIVINNMTADGRTYDIRLSWRTAIQGYAITQIIPTGVSGGGGGGGGPIQGSIFSGQVGQVWEDGLRLDTSNGSITVDTYDICGDNTRRFISVGDQITITGEFERGEFDAFSITRVDGASVCRSR